MLFKKGDKVTVRDDLNYDTVYCMEGNDFGIHPTRTMVNFFRGKELTISNADLKGDGYFCEETGNDFWWTDAMFEVYNNEPIKEGDIVEVINPGQQYSSYTRWFINNDVDIDDCLHFAYGEEIDERMNYEVLKVADHGQLPDTLAMVRDRDLLYGGIYLISTKGIRRVYEN